MQETEKKMPVRIGLVGAGRMGWDHAERIHWQIPQAELSAVCSVVPAELERVKREFGTPVLYDDYHSMLAEEQLDAVAIASPVAFHVDQIAAALAAGKHVFCEKPLGVDVADCKRAVEIIKDYPQLKVMIGFMRRFDDSYAHAKQRIDEGAIGKPIMVRCCSIDSVSMIDTFLPFAKNSGGVFSDTMVHDFDLVQWLCNDEITMVHAIGGCYKYEELAQYRDADNAVCLAQLRGGQMGLFYVGRHAPHGYHVETEIIGTEATMRIGATPQKNDVVMYDRSGVRVECVQNFQQRFARAYLNELRVFIDCIQGDGEVPISAQDGLQAAVVATAATASYHQQRAMCIQKNGEYIAQ